jgi:protein phosphatase 1 regulatory subunit 37
VFCSSLFIFAREANSIIQLLEAMVERPPPRPLIDEFGMDLDLTLREEISPSLHSPESPSEDPKKPTPRPYISRARSSEAVSPTTGHPRSPSLRSPSPVVANPTSPVSPVVAGKPYLVRSRSSNSVEATETQ